MLVIVVVGSLGVVAYAAVTSQRNVASVVALPTPSPTPHEVIAVQDTLSSNTQGWLESSHCFFKDGSFHIKDNWYCYLAAKYYDTRITVQVRQVSGPLNGFYGIVFHFNTGPSYYTFMIDSSGDWVPEKCEPDNCHGLQHSATTGVIHTGLGATNMLTVLTQGSHFEFFVNNTQVGQADDNTLISGSMGLVAGGNIEAEFSNLTIEVPTYN